MGVLAGLCVTYAVIVVGGWLTLWPMDARQTRDNVRRQDLSTRAEEALVVFITTTGVVAMATVLAMRTVASQSAGAVLALVGVFLAWGTLHLMYAARYTPTSTTASPRAASTSTMARSRPTATSSTSPTTSG